MNTYTSPYTGIVYQIETETSTRMAGDWYAGEPLRKVTVTQYNFLRDGKRVTFTFDLDEKRLSDTFGELEGVYAAWATSARD